MTNAIKIRRSSRSRREFLSLALSAPAIGLIAIHETASARTAHSVFAGDITVSSPDRKLRFELLVRDRLAFRVSRNNQLVIDVSPLSFIVDGVDLSESATVKGVETYNRNEKYAARGVHSTALDRCNGARVSMAHLKSQTPYSFEVRVFNDGIAFRHVVPGTNEARVPDEASVFKLPAGSTVWFHDFEGHYEGIHKKYALAEVKAGEWAAPPLTIKFPNDIGYAAISEAALIDYAGMGLQADGAGGFKIVLGHALPVSHPFDLRYGKAEAARLAKPAIVTGTITTPWRVIMLGADLNALVNCNLIDSLAPPPERKFFPAGVNTDWVKPGRAVWKYLDGGENTLAGMKEFSQLAGQLGFEYNVIEGFWQRWPETEMRELVDYSKQQRVGIWFWKHSKDLRSPAARQEFFALLNRVGVVGAKIDFFDHEAKEIIDLYQTLLREAAEHRIMLEFHGANKPAGEARTWPNEMTREAIRGLEYRSMQTRAEHNTTLPFTRFLAGHADYTPLIFGERRKETSWTHQIASAIVFTSPLLIYGAHPKSILENPAANLIMSIPSVWDETIVVNGSEIGEVAAFARRNGSTWFVGTMNGPQAREIDLRLEFLDRGNHHASIVRDVPDDPAAVKIETSTTRKDNVLHAKMRVGGGLVARFSVQ